MLKERMFVETHILQNFAPSNLNRDDTGAPKDCEFGGYRRARISSQCLKRAARTYVRENSLLPEDALSCRTKLLRDELVSQLRDRDKDPEVARRVVESMLAAAGLPVDKEGKTQYLLFLGRCEIAKLADLCCEHWDTLAEIAADANGAKGNKDTKKAARAAAPIEIKRSLEILLDGGKAADLALFGRMLADRPGNNVDAACQVAHALSTHRVSMDMDFYTAVDDLLPEDTTGAGMLGTLEFNSACFYRYANVDLRQLSDNLDDHDLALRTVEAFLRAFIHAVPTGKQNSTAAQNPPSFVMTVVRNKGLWSLANAFLKPVRADENGDLVANSIKALDTHWSQLSAMYGEDGIVGKWWAALDGESIVNLKSARADGVEDLIGRTISAIAGQVGSRSG